VSESPSRVAVTGGLGVSGVWVVRQLIAEGCDVVVYERHDDLSAAPDLLGRVRCELVDVTDFAALSAAVERDSPGCVVHLAAVLPDVVNARPRVGFAVNVGGTLNVLEAARVNGVARVVAASARAYYGVSTGEYATGRYRPIPEDYPPADPNSYGWTKVAMEDVVRWYRRDFGLSATSLRFSSIYGPGKAARHGVHNLISGMIESAHRHEPVTIESGGDQCTDFLFVEDAARGIVAAVLAPELAYDAYNICPGTKTSLREFARATNEAAGGEYVTVGPGLDYYGFGKDLYGILDDTRARRSLGFRANYTVAAGVRRYMELIERGS
jgi:UDP-glucose 4-epimerase